MSTHQHQVDNKLSCGLVEQFFLYSCWVALLLSSACPPHHRWLSLFALNVTSNMSFSISPSRTGHSNFCIRLWYWKADCHLAPCRLKTPLSSRWRRRQVSFQCRARACFVWSRCYQHFAPGIPQTLSPTARCPQRLSTRPYRRCFGCILRDGNRQMFSLWFYESVLGWSSTQLVQYLLVY